MPPCRSRSAGIGLRAPDAFHDPGHHLVLGAQRGQHLGQLGVLVAEVRWSPSSAGLTIEQAMDAYRIIWHYTAGEIAARAAAAKRREDGSMTYRDRVFAELDAREYARLSEVGRRWAGLTARDTYEQGLRALVRGLLPAKTVAARARSVRRSGSDDQLE
ncbi:TetR/AcrR family transcriptional regulator C-terminal domain-containing protein [Nonomuraea sp. B1E8]|uniref:TetR/AcrR family transcriptional regulator C-terminal domain-containing protein n=1 Tax=unclassified Nonomuraea TaxID=2593643 RepID=UPI00325F0553